MKKKGMSAWLTVAFQSLHYMPLSSHIFLLLESSFSTWNSSKSIDLFSCLVCLSFLFLTPDVQSATSHIKLGIQYWVGKDLRSCCSHCYQTVFLTVLNLLQYVIHPPAVLESFISLITFVHRKWLWYLLFFNIHMKCINWNWHSCIFIAYTYLLKKYKDLFFYFIL